MAAIDLGSYKRAEVIAAREEGRRGFTVHAVVTVLVCIGLVVLNVTVATGFPWSLFAIGGMGIGLFVHWYFGVAHVEESTRRHQEEIEHRAAA